MEAFFLEVTGSYRFCIRHPPRAGVRGRGGMLFLHPFAEEMNKTRRVVAQAARALAEDGWDVLQIDLLGCGDSAGEFEDATWDAWREDVACAYRWLKGHCTDVWLWGLRAGCLLASAAAGEGAAGLLLWQPVLTGQHVLQQQLRLRTLRHALAAEGSAPQQAAVREELRQRGTVEIGGYAITQALAERLERVQLLPPGAQCPVIWLEVSAREETALSPAAAARVQRWRDAGSQVQAEAVPGPQFWQTQEISECPALVSRTRELMSTTA